MISRPTAQHKASAFKQIKHSTLRGVFRIVPPRTTTSIAPGSAPITRTPAKQQ